MSRNKDVELRRKKLKTALALLAVVMVMFIITVIFRQ